MVHNEACDGCHIHLHLQLETHVQYPNDRGEHHGGNGVGSHQQDAMLLVLLGLVKLVIQVI